MTVFAKWRSRSLWAFGVRIGADGKWSLAPHLYLVGAAETSILFSDNTSSLTETEGSTTILNLADDYEQALPVLGTRIGRLQRQLA
jgi:hypothetical protein